MENIKKDILLKYFYIHLPKILFSFILIIEFYLTYSFLETENNFLVSCFSILFYYIPKLLGLMLLFENYDKNELGFMSLIFIVSFIPLINIFTVLSLIDEGFEINWKNKIA